MPMPSLVRRVTPAARYFALSASLLSTAIAQHWLTEPLQVSSPSNEPVRAFADFDGDGRRDLVATRFAAQLAITTFWIAFGTAGDYAAGPSQPLLPTGAHGECYVLAGDMTGDGLPDVVMSYSNQFGTPGGGFVTYRNLGGGTFAPPLHTLAGESVWPPKSGALTDWNGDGVFELLATTRNGLVVDLRRWTWQGSGFVSSNTLTMPGQTGEIAVGDVTGDGLPDAVLSCETDSRVFIVPSLPGGGLGAVSTILVGPTPTLYGHVPSCGDVDGDGDQDIVVAWPTYLTGSNLVIVTNDGGSFTVGPTQFVSLLPGNTWRGNAWITDQDGDGDGDVLLAHEQLCTLENIGGTLHARGAKSMEPHSSGPTTNGHEGVGVADFDGDQRPDFVGAHAIVFGTGRFENDAFGPSSVFSPSRAVDDDDDGDLDLLGATGERRENRGSDVWVTHTGRFPPTSPPFRYEFARAIGDFTGDGRVDQLVDYVQGTYPFVQLVGMHLLEGRADGSLFDRGLAGPPGTFVGVGAIFVAHRDLDGDSDVDIAAQGGWWENDGSGTFTTFHAAWTGKPLELVDVNGDSRIDVLTQTSTGSTTAHWLYLAQAAGGYAGTQLASSSLVILPPLGTLADLDDDGDLDFVVGTATGPAIQVFANQGGVFAPPLLLASRNSAFEVILVDDFDRDGRTDIAAASQSTYGDVALVWRRLGTGLAYGAPRSYVTSTSMQGNPADLDGDGDPDLHSSQDITRSGRWSGVEAGRHSQYGASEPGASGLGPILGVQGPVRSTGTMVVRLRRAPPNSFAALDFGITPADLPGVPFPGLTLRVAPLILLILGTPGTPGVAGSGAADLPIAAPPGLLGQRFYMQAFTLDGNSFGASNGLELVLGL
ncbi:MAG TPA: FG-GAP-like repeat-containing protein [Planctomycetota bacterium]